MVVAGSGANGWWWREWEVAMAVRNANLWRVRGERPKIGRGRRAAERLGGKCLWGRDLHGRAAPDGQCMDDEGCGHTQLRYPRFCLGAQYATTTTTTTLLW